MKKLYPEIRGKSIAKDGNLVPTVLAKLSDRYEQLIEWNKEKRPGGWPEGYHTILAPLKQPEYYSRFFEQVGFNIELKDSRIEVRQQHLLNFFKNGFLPHDNNKWIISPFLYIESEFYSDPVQFLIKNNHAGSKNAANNIRSTGKQIAKLFGMIDDRNVPTNYYYTFFS